MEKKNRFFHYIGRVSRIQRESCRLVLCVSVCVGERGEQVDKSNAYAIFAHTGDEGECRGHDSVSTDILEPLGLGYTSARAGFAAARLSDFHCKRSVPRDSDTRVVHVIARRVYNINIIMIFARQ